jgi:hypothetical protein
MVYRSTYNENDPAFSMYDMDYVHAHELSHRMDMLEYKSYNNKEFLDAIEKSKQVVEERRDEIQAWFGPGGKFQNEMAMSDLVSALSKNSIVGLAGHKADYWEKPDRVPMEIFADISAIDVLELPGKDELNTVFNDLRDAYKGVVK